MTIENVMLTLNRVPEIKAVIDSGTDWKILGGFVLTAAAVFAGSMVTIWTFRKTVHSQEELARKVSVKQSRQEWINELRNCCANYVASVMALREHQVTHPTRSELAIKLLEMDPASAANMLIEWGNSRNLLFSSAYSLRAKVILLSNPKEKLFKELLVEVNGALANAGSGAEDAVAHCDRVIDLSQQILKIEWDRARKMAE
jgi:hypothetical protein